MLNSDIIECIKTTAKKERNT